MTAVPFPDGVASPDGSAGFVELRSGGVGAIELSSGRDLWTAARPARPRLVVEGWLVAQDRQRSHGNLLQMVRLDLGAGSEPAPPIAPVVLPDWVSVADPEQVFEYDIWAEGNELVIAWRAEAYYAGGAPPPPHIEAQARREARAQVRVSLRTGQVEREAPSPAGDPADSAGESARTPSLSGEAAALARVTPDGARQSCAVAGRGFYLAEPAASGPAEGPRLVCVDLRTGEQLWERTLPGRPIARPPARRL